MRAWHLEPSYAKMAPRRGCGCNTRENHVVWLNTPADFETLSNTVGAWMLTLYADGCMIYFGLVGDMWSSTCAVVFLVVSSLAMWSLLKVMLSDPGAVPSGATASRVEDMEGYCAKCDQFKPKSAYHCSKCRRCVVRMDHHCPFTNNCVGVMNQKPFILFLLYCILQAILAMVRAARATSPRPPSPVVPVAGAHPGAAPPARPR